VVPKTYELTEFLVDVLGVTDVGAYYPHKVTYHPTCHGLRSLGLGDRPLKLLQAVKGLELVELPGADECCGFGGTFAVNEEAVSCMMGQDRIADHERGGAEIITGTDSSCLMHLDGLIRRAKKPLRVMHVAEVLAESQT
jgi:L-lactate dehydrogenase complex protein LldE